MGVPSRTSTGIELFLFVTPRVLHDDEGARAVTGLLQERAAKVSK